MSNEKMRIQLPSIYQDHMMLQREKPIRIRGRVSDVVATVTVELSDGSWKPPVLERLDEVPAEVTDQVQRVTVKVESGSFACDFPAQSAARDKTLRLYVNGEHRAEVTIADICIGDIWMACGQSNMEYFLRYDAHYNDLKQERENPDIRMFNVPQIAFAGQEKECFGSGYWFTKDDPAWAVFSAPGYTFARAIQEQYGVPVGVIGCNWGGTPACAWVDERYLTGPLEVYQEEYREAVRAWDAQALKEASFTALAFENSYRHELEWRTMMYGLTWEEQQQWMREHAGDPELPMGPYHHYRPTGLYDTMIRTVAPFSVKGILWYQGESDQNHAALYGDMLKATIQCFRDTWKDAQLPFLLVQLAPFARWLQCNGDHFEVVREMQDAVSREVEGVHMVSIMDLGDHDDIHPKFKKEVGERLALLARSTVYGEDLLCQSPQLELACLCGQELTLTFSNAAGGLTAGEGAIDAFAVLSRGEPVAVTGLQSAGEKLVLTLGQDVSANDLTVCFAYAPYSEVKIWNAAGLPVKPFRHTV